MKILQVCNFSSGISGVWTRVLEDSREFIKRGHEVYVFSSNQQENEEATIHSKEHSKEGIWISRFPIKKKMGYAIWFDFEKEALELKPDVIICHGLRKPYLGPAVKIAKKLGIKCFLITHAPFIEKELRSWKLNAIIWFYDYFLGAGIMNSFDKIIAICKWEEGDLLKRGCDRERIIYLPNSLSEEFFVQEPVTEEKKVIFLGRMNPVKKLEDLITAFFASSLEEYILEIVSSKEGAYYDSLVSSLQALGIGSNILFTSPVSDLTEKIKKIDSSGIFVLPSQKESLPFGIIEAMARGKIVVATKTLGATELIKDNENGFLIEIGDVIGLKNILNKIKEMPEEEKSRIKLAAKEKAEEFRVSKIMNQWEKLFQG